MLIKLLVWAGERISEILAGSVISFLVFGPSFPDAPGYLDEFRINLAAVLFFYVVGGYIISGVAFGLFARRRSWLLHGAIMACLFVAHALIFFLFLADGISFPLLAISAGAAAVFLINAAGAAILAARAPILPRGTIGGASQET